MGRSKKALIANLSTYQHYNSQLSELYMTTKEIENLPDSCDLPFMMRHFRDEGAVVLLDDPILGVIPLALGGVTEWGPTGLPLAGYAIDYWGKQYSFTPKNGTVVYANYGYTSATPSIPACEIDWYSKKLTEIDLTLSTNVYAMRTPIVLAMADEKQRESMKKMFEVYDGHEPFIYADKKFRDLNDIKAINTGVVDYTVNLRELKKDVWNSALTYVGVPNSSVEKRERLNVQEVVTNNSGVVAMRYSPLKAIQTGLDRFNKISGTDMHIQYSDASQAYIDGYNDYDKKKEEFHALVQKNEEENNGADNS